MKILLVEDDENKRQEVREFLRGLVPSGEIVEARSYHSGFQSLRDIAFDRIILDMTMPTYDTSEREHGGRPQAYGGRDLLRLMKRRSITTPVLVLTQFDRFGDGTDLQALEELDQELRTEYAPVFRGSVYYNLADEAWRIELARFIL